MSNLGRWGLSLVRPGAIAAVVSCFVLAGYIMFLENSLIYFPQKGGVGPSPGEDVFLTASDGVRIHGWYVASAGAKTTLLWFHGNAGNLENRRDMMEGLRELRVHILAIDYRGYGKSEGRPDEPGVYRDGRAAYQWLVETKRAAPERIVVLGESLGAAVACELATQVKCGGLIIQSGFTSAAEMAPLVLPIFPARWFLRTKFDNLAKVSRITCPKLFLHAVDDEVIPFAMGQRLCAAAAPPKECAWLQAGGHNGVFLRAAQEYYPRLRKFLEKTGEEK